MIFARMIVFVFRFDSEDWKTFTSRPALPFCLKILSGLCTRHKRVQELVAESAIPGLHRLEQVLALFSSSKSLVCS